MSNEYLLVKYSDDRDVIADGDIVGKTNTIVMLSTGEHLLSLTGTGYLPKSKEIVLAGTTVDAPLEVLFTAKKKRPTRKNQNV